jgi:hypothetical protein
MGGELGGIERVGTIESDRCVVLVSMDPLLLFQSAVLNQNALMNAVPGSR